MLSIYNPYNVVPRNRRATFAFRDTTYRNPNGEYKNGYLEPTELFEFRLSSEFQMDSIDLLPDCVLPFDSTTLPEGASEAEYDYYKSQWDSSEIKRCFDDYKYMHRDSFQFTVFETNVYSHLVNFFGAENNFLVRFFHDGVSKFYSLTYSRFYSELEFPKNEFKNVVLDIYCYTTYYDFEQVISDEYIIDISSLLNNLGSFRISEANFYKLLENTHNAQGGHYYGYIPKEISEYGTNPNFYGISNFSPIYRDTFDYFTQVKYDKVLDYIDDDNWKHYKYVYSGTQSSSSPTRLFPYNNESLLFSVTNDPEHPMYNTIFFIMVNSFDILYSETKTTYLPSPSYDISKRAYIGDYYFTLKSFTLPNNNYGNGDPGLDDYIDSIVSEELPEKKCCLAECFGIKE